HRLPRSSLFPFTTLFRSMEHHGVSVDLLGVSLGEDALEGGRSRRLRGRVGDEVERVDHIIGGKGLAVMPLHTLAQLEDPGARVGDRKSTRLNSSHSQISY